MIRHIDVNREDLRYLQNIFRENLSINYSPNNRGDILLIEKTKMQLFYTSMDLVRLTFMEEGIEQEKFLSSEINKTIDDYYIPVQNNNALKTAALTIFKTKLSDLLYYKILCFITTLYYAEGKEYLLTRDNNKETCFIDKKTKQSFMQPKLPLYYFSSYIKNPKPLEDDYLSYNYKFLFLSLMFNFKDIHTLYKVLYICVHYYNDEFNRRLSLERQSESIT